MRTAFLLPLLLLLTSCSSLKVQVDVLNPEVVRELAANDRLSKTMPDVMAIAPASMREFFAERINIHSAAYDRMREAYQEEAEKYPGGSPDRNQLNCAAESSVFPAELRESYFFFETRATATIQALQSNWPIYEKTGDPSERRRLRNSLTAALDELGAVYQAIEELIAKDLDLAAMQDRLSSLPPQVRSNVINAIRRSVSDQMGAQQHQLFDPGNIQHSPYAYLVAKAPDTDWALKFDNTFGYGLFGNTDIAIKALGPGNFTIKGVSFNPADVAVTAAKVTSQTVLLAAQIAGVPVKLSGSTEATKPGAALAQSSQIVSQAIAKNDSVDASIIAHRDALHRVAAALSRERKVISSGNDAERRSALDSIKAVYDSHAARLRVSTN